MVVKRKLLAIARATRDRETVGKAWEEKATSKIVWEVVGGGVVLRRHDGDPV